jgi:hypothetical protein
LGVLFLVSWQFSAQELYMPRNIKKAYENGTRDLSGAPGKNYWQNKGIYNVEVKVDANSKVVSGKETIVYTNNSPNDLNDLAIRFVNNLHKPQAPRSGVVSKDFLSSGLHIKSFAVNGEKYNVNSDDWGTVEKVKLNSALKSKAKAEIKIEWEYPLSVQSGREGQIDPETFYVAILSREFLFMMITMDGICFRIPTDRSFIMISTITVLRLLLLKITCLGNRRFPES